MKTQKEHPGKAVLRKIAIFSLILIVGFIAFGHFSI